MYDKLTKDKFEKEVQSISDLGNPEMKQIINIVDQRIKEYKKFLEFFPIWTSNWFLRRYESRPSEQHGGKRWTFTILIAIQPDGKNEFESIEHFRDYPEFGCVMLSLHISIPNFTGGNLDITDGKRINFSSGSNWDVYLIHPKYGVREEKRHERLEFTTSLPSIESIFEIPITVKAYIMTHFERYQQFYRHLNTLKIKEMEK
jgi:hypothetical protein